MLLNGYLAPDEFDGKDVNGEFGQIITALTSWGWPSVWTGGAAVYNCDRNYTWNIESHGKDGVADKHSLALGGRTQTQNHRNPGACGNVFFPRPITGTHTTNTAIEHLAYHWAWMLHDLFPTTCVNAVGHSMGALIIRYALARVQQGDPEFPDDVCVDDVISLGGVHNGSTKAPPCATILNSYQCAEMVEGSNFLQWLAVNARDPQGVGGTDWTNYGSTGDDSALVPGAVNTTMDPAHAVIYEEDVRHTSGDGGAVYWKNATQSTIDANIRWTDRAIGSETTTLDGPWPIRHADMSMAYNQWGCGVGNTTSAFPLVNGLETVGEPYTTSFDCWYYVDVPPNQQLTVKMSSLNNRNLDLYLYQGSPSGTRFCSPSALTTETCTVTVTNSGRWYMQVRNTAATRDPFTIQATYQNDCNTGADAGGDFASATPITTPKSSCSSFVSPPLEGEDWYQFPVTLGQAVNVSASPAINTNVDLCLYGPSGAAAQCSTSGGTAITESISLTAGTTGNWRMRVYSPTGAPPGYYTMSAALVTAQNDCGTGGDAANAPPGTPLTLPQTNCSGQLLPGEGDNSDYYKFTATNGQTINASMTPNASSNFDICIYNSAGSLVSGCTSGTTGGTDTLSYAVMATGEYRLRVKVTSGTGSYTMSVSLAGLVIRRDDDERDTSMPLDLNDDVANKRLPVAPADVSGKTTATLYVLGQAYGCTGAPPGNKFTLKANGNLVANVNPCNDWSTSGYSWKAYNVPLSWLVFGENTFRYDHISGSGDHLTRNVNLAIDSDTDVGASDTNVNSGSEVPGELMWYLVLN